MWIFINLLKVWTLLPRGLACCVQEGNSWTKVKIDIGHKNKNKVLRDSLVIWKVKGFHKRKCTFWYGHINEYGVLISYPSEHTANEIANTLKFKVTTNNLISGNFSIAHTKPPPGQGFCLFR